MSRTLRIVFMGTPDFAIPSLEGLWQSKHEVVGVVTAPDKPAGRGRKLKSSPVKDYAQKRGLPILQPGNLKSPEFLETLQALEPDLQVVVAFRKLPGEVWSFPPFGTFNLHASLLPDYRGAAPINWAIINGEKETGVSTFFLQEGIDTGALIHQEKVSIGPDETAGELHDRLMEAGKELVVKSANAIAEGNAPKRPQVASQEIKKAPKIHSEDCKINWEWSIDYLHNFIRGLSPFPGAWTIMGGKHLKLLRAKKERGAHDQTPGTISTDQKNYLKVAAPGGYLNLFELKLEGKKAMTVKDFLNGINVENGGRLGE